MSKQIVEMDEKHEELINYNNLVGERITKQWFIKRGMDLAYKELKKKHPNFKSNL